MFNGNNENQFNALVSQFLRSSLLDEIEMNYLYVETISALWYAGEAFCQIVAFFVKACFLLHSGDLKFYIISEPSAVVVASKSEIYLGITIFYVTFMNG